MILHFDGDRVGLKEYYKLERDIFDILKEIQGYPALEISKENIKINNEIDIKFRNLDILIKTETNIKENEIKNIQNLQNNNNHYQKEIDYTQSGSTSC